MKVHQVWIKVPWSVQPQKHCEEALGKNLDKQSGVIYQRDNILKAIFCASIVSEHLEIDNQMIFQSCKVNIEHRSYSYFFM